MSVVGILNTNTIILKKTPVFRAALLSINFQIMFGDALRLVLESTIFGDAFFSQHMRDSLCADAGNKEAVRSRRSL